jgi:antitoxin (DNA-binding transcriptional repressor) of toxin-antitoxin stability system
MKPTIGLAEAKARFSEVIDRVVAGQTIVISRNGAPAVEMRPVTPVPAGETVRRIRALRRRIAKSQGPVKTGVRLRELAHKGHRR